MSKEKYFKKITDFVTLIYKHLKRSLKLRPFLKLFTKEEKKKERKRK